MSGPKQWYHARVVVAGRPAVFFLDLELHDLIRDLFVPMHKGGALYLDGRQAQASELFSVKLVATDGPLLPELKTWFVEKQLSALERPAEVFLRERQTFELEPDVTNRLMHGFRASVEWQEIRDLLNEEGDLLRESATEGSQGEVAGSTQARLEQVADRITHLAGIFMSGYLRFG